MRFKARFLTLLKAIIQVKAHSRKGKNGQVAQVQAHTRYIQSAAERKEMIAKLAAQVAQGGEPKHKTAASALGLARHLSKQDKGATYHVARTEDGHHVVRKGEAPAGGDRIHVKAGKATLHRADGETRSLKHLKGPVWLEGEAAPHGMKAPEPKQAKTKAVAGDGAPGKDAGASDDLMAQFKAQRKERDEQVAAFTQALNDGLTAAQALEKIGEKPGRRNEKHFLALSEKAEAKAKEQARQDELQEIRTRNLKAKQAEPKPKGTPAQAGEDAYVDVGEKIGMARKDVWAALNGEGLNYTQIDWDEVAKNPDLAERHITKANLTKALTPEALERAGMPPDLAYLANKMLDTIPAKPAVDSLGARKAFAEGLWRIQRSIFAITKREDYSELRYDMGNILRGFYVKESDLGLYNEANAMRGKANVEIAKIKSSEEYVNGEEEVKHLYKEMGAAESTLLGAKYGRRLKGERKEQAIREAQEAYDQARKAWSTALEQHKESKASKDIETLKTLSEGIARTNHGLAKEGAESDEGKAVRASIQALGDRFAAFAKGQGAFWDKHFYAVASGEIKDYSWAGPKERPEAGKSEPKEVNPDKRPKWVREVPDEAMRIGGTKLPTQSSADLMKAFGLRAVEYGNWVSQDEAEHHTSRAAEAFMDMANLLGLDQDDISYGGRLAMAFGARGTGHALAHYEPGRKVINMTKMSGGGSLAHEWGHFLDNVLFQVHQDDGGDNSFISEDGLPKNAPPKVKEAWEHLWKTMTTSPEGGFAKRTVKPGKRRILHGTVGRLFREGVTDPQELLKRAVDGHMENLVAHYKAYGRALDASQIQEKRAKAEAELGPAVASYTGKPVQISDPSRPRQTEWVRLADAQQGSYWNAPSELFARAFEAHVEDRLIESGAANTYLVTGTHPESIAGKAGKRPSPDNLWPYPQGKEREAIGKAMAAYIDAVKESGALKKALGLLGRMAG